MALDKADANRCDDLSDMLGSMNTMAAQQVGTLVTAVFSLAGVKSPQICSV